MPRSARFVAAICFAAALPAHAETVDCTNIDHLPASIELQGVYCLKQDLSTAITSGTAITITTNNVTIDCNGHKLGGLAAGAGTRAVGIQALGRTNTVVRNCSVRGYYLGISMNGGAGHVIEHNRLDGNTYAGIVVVDSDGDIIRDNYIVDTGGNLPVETPPYGRAFGIGVQPATGLLLEGNTIVNTFATAGSARTATGIGLYGAIGVVQDNRIIGVVPDGPASAAGIEFTEVSTPVRVLARGNSIVNPVQTTGSGLLVDAEAEVTCQDNLAKGFATLGIGGCADAGGNHAD